MFFTVKNGLGRMVILALVISRVGWLLVGYWLVISLLELLWWGQQWSKAKGRSVTLNLFNGVIAVEKLKMNDFKHLLGFG